MYLLYCYTLTHSHTHTHTTVAYRRVMHEGDGYGAGVLDAGPFRRAANSRATSSLRPHKLVA